MQCRSHIKTDVAERTTVLSNGDVSRCAEK